MPDHDQDENGPDPQPCFCACGSDELATYLGSLLWGEEEGGELLWNDGEDLQQQGQGTQVDRPYLLLEQIDKVLQDIYMYLPIK